MTRLYLQAHLAHATPVVGGLAVYLSMARKSQRLPVALGAGQFRL